MGLENSASPVVGLLSAQVPRELVYALGCKPVRVFPTVGKPTAAEALLPRNFCALTRLILASFLEDGGPNLDAVIFADTDDAERRLHDVWLARMPVPVWGFVEIPRVTSSLAVKRYTDILVRLVANLETHTGQRLDPAALHQAILLYNEQRDLLIHVKRHWRAGRVDTPSYRRLRKVALTRDPMVANETLRQALVDCEQQPNASVPTPSCRLLLLAELAAPAGLIRLVEAYDARVVAEDSDLDERQVTEPISIDAKTVEEMLGVLAKAYLTKPPDPRMRDMSRRVDYLEQLVAEQSVCAAICAYSKFCDLYLAEFPALRMHLDGLGVPVLLLELEDESIGGQHRTRIEAFLEMLNQVERAGG